MSDKVLAFIFRKLGFNIQTPAASFTAGLVGDSSPFSVLPRVRAAVQLTSATELDNRLISGFSYTTLLFIIHKFHQNIHFSINSSADHSIRDLYNGSACLIPLSFQGLEESTATDD